MEYTLEKTYEDINHIAECVERSDWKPDLIVGIQRGGLIPAVMLSHRLKLKMKTVAWSTRDNVEKDVPFGVQLAHDYAKKQLLIVDDIVDSGLTAREVRKILPKARFASLIWNIREAQGAPDYFGRTIDRNIDKEWVNFWWEM